ncbi:LSU ribosomal protein L7AE [Geobacillus sp. WSUCF1]|nr:LSU ribosomal protein L7AE [Geobacillus sp. WSUCF1]
MDWRSGRAKSSPARSLSSKKCSGVGRGSSCFRKTHRSTPKKKVTDKCTFYGVPLCKVPDRYVLGGAIGKDARVVVAVIDEGFARQLQTMLDRS